MSVEKEMVVTQEDRERAARLQVAFGPEIRRGNCDSFPMIQAFAAHRIAALQSIEGIVGALEAARAALEKRGIWGPLMTQIDAALATYLSIHAPEGERP